MKKYCKIQRHSFFAFIIATFSFECSMSIFSIAQRYVWQNVVQNIYIPPRKVGFKEIC